MPSEVLNLPLPTPNERDQGPRPIFVVLGMHRSGTSLCSSIMHAIGIDMTEDKLVERGNEFGHWERADIVEIQDTILNVFDRNFFSPMHDFPLPPGWWRDPKIRPLGARLDDILTQDLSRAAPFGFKDPRTVKLLPLWTSLFAQRNLRPKFVVCLRNPAHVTQSLKARDGLNHLVSEYRWLDYTVDCFRYTRGADVCVIDYEEWFIDPLATLERLERFADVGHGYSPEDVRMAVEALIRPEANHADEKTQRACQPLVRGFYGLARHQRETQAGQQRLLGFIEHFTTFRQLLVPFEGKLRAAQDATQNAIREADGRIAALSAEHQGSVATLQSQESAHKVVQQALSEARQKIEALTAAQTHHVSSLQATETERDAAKQDLSDSNQRFEAASAEHQREAAVIHQALSEANQRIAALTAEHQREAASAAAARQALSEADQRYEALGVEHQREAAAAVAAHQALSEANQRYEALGVEHQREAASAAVAHQALSEANQKMEALTAAHVHEGALRQTAEAALKSANASLSDANKRLEEMTAERKAASIDKKGARRWRPLFF